MRMFMAAVIAAFAFFAAPALAGPVTLRPATFSPEFQTKLDRTLGAREGVYLQDRIERSLTRALAEQGSHVALEAPIIAETTILDARANRPTFAELTRNVSIDYLASQSTGGASLVGVLRSADGQELARIEHRYFQDDLHLAAPTDWGDAERAIDQYAAKVARAYRQQAGS